MLAPNQTIELYVAEQPSTLISGTPIIGIKKTTYFGYFESKAKVPKLVRKVQHFVFMFTTENNKWYNIMIMLQYKPKIKYLNIGYLSQHTLLYPVFTNFIQIYEESKEP